jgi:D-arabinose 1-dehydrogenase-like Zn-dependent alcohol dehydrogenase
MIVKCLQTTGQGYFEEVDFDKPDPTENEIEVRAVLTGVCRSDIDMMQGNFGPLPLHMQGHEGLGQVTKIGAKIRNIRIGDYVATRGEPAYADYYNVRINEFVRVPSPEPKYILEPVACGVNCVMQAIDQIEERSRGKCLILGSGFLAWVAYHTLEHHFPLMEVDVLGSSNLDLWGDNLLFATTESYDIVIDLSGKYELGTEINLNNEALIVDAVGKAVTKEEAQAQLWKAVTTIKPSPRTEGFINAMQQACWLIENGELSVDSFWTKAYNRTTEWQQAFDDGVNRPNGYSRGYIKWD